MTKEIFEKNSFMVECSHCGFKYQFKTLLSSVINYGIIRLLSGFEEDDNYFGFVCDKCNNGPNTTVLKKSKKYVHSLMDTICIEAFFRKNIYENSIPKPYKVLRYNSFPYPNLLNSLPGGTCGITRFFNPREPQFEALLKAPVNIDKIKTKANNLGGNYLFTYDGNYPHIKPICFGYLFEKKYIDKLVGLENKTKIKSLPRYIIDAPMYSDINHLCWHLYWKFEYSWTMASKHSWQKFTDRETLFFLSHNEVKSNYKFLEILEKEFRFEEEDHVINLYRSQFTGLTRLLNDPKTSKDEFQIQKTDNGIIPIKWNSDIRKRMKSVWSEFTKAYFQDLISGMALNFALEYTDLSRQLDCTYGDIWNLKKKYFDLLVKASIHRNKRKSVKNVVLKKEKELVAKAKESFPGTTIITASHNINKIILRIPTIQHIDANKVCFLTDVPLFKSAIVAYNG